jgi:hypothetical protein
VHQLSDIVTALSHLRKPLLRNGPQLSRAIGQPDVNSRISFYRSGESPDVLPTAQPAEVERNATRSTAAHNAADEPRAATAQPAAKRPLHSGRLP